MTTAAIAVPAVRPTPAVHSRLGRAGLYGAVAGALVVAAVVALGVTTALRPQARTACSFGCPPPTGAPLPEQRTYTSSALGFAVDYSSRWHLSNRAATGADFRTQAGLFEVAGVRGSQSLAQLIADRVGALPGEFEDVHDLGSIPGAHVGTQPGIGEMFGATFVPTGGAALPVRIPVVAAQRGGIAVLAIAVDPYDDSGDSGPSGVPEADSFDYALTEFRWPAGS